ncbi:Mob1/phocein family protein [Trichoderma guizhouense]|uniref:Mob1/phocein family protein n=1 Tax=Trichoderma guizhouense TaxID=1491466 RepID=A0A1T3CC03_9HYPO|nr:Mob1/phocein family protein [Trichoderma guizhouense]
MSNLFSGIKAQIRGNSAKAGPPVKSPTTPTASEAGASAAASLHRTAAADHYPSASSTSSSAPRVTLPESLSIAKSIDVVVPTPLDIPQPLPLWLNTACAKHIVKGNFMTLSARPKTVDHGEWVAHQVVEHYRNLWNFVRVLHEKEEDGTSICNPTTCPKMSAGKNHSYTWLNRNHEPVELPAYEYMTLMQRWMSGKMDDPALFPTDPDTVSFAIHPEYTSNAAQQGPDEWLGARSGFPKQLGGTCQLIFRQIFRVYAHLYWDHFVEPFYHLNLEKQLNSCFSHFILTATTLEMLQPSELEPMQYLIDLWAADGTFPPESRPYSYANVERGRYIQSLGTAV